MSEIIFYNTKNKEFIFFSNFDFKYLKEPPHIFEYELSLQSGASKIRKTFGGTLADFDGFVSDVNKMQQNKIHKFYFYPSVESDFYMTFEPKNEGLVEVHVNIKDYIHMNEVKIRDEMRISQMSELIDQFDLFLKKVKKI